MILPLFLALFGSAAQPGPADPPWPAYRLAGSAQSDPLDGRVGAFRAIRTPIDLAFLELSRSIGLTFVLDPTVKGDVTLDFREGTARDLVDALARSQGCSWERAGKVVAIHRFATRIYEIDYPQMNRSAQGSSNVALSAQSAATPATGGLGGSVPGTAAAAQPGAGSPALSTDQTGLTITQQNQGNFWADVQGELAGLAQAGESVLVNRFAGIAVVTAPPARQEIFRMFIVTLNRRISRQVRIAARVVEVDLNASHQMGVDWSLATAKAGGITLSGVQTATAFTTVNGQALGTSTLSGTLSTGSVSAVIQALDEQGEVHAVSNPSVLSLSNQTAFVKVGTEQTFFSLSNSTVINQSGSVAPVSTTQSTYTQTAITIGTVLYVTPEVNEDGTVTVDVLPAITQLVGVDTSPDGQQTAPRMDIKALSTIARLRPDQSVMIGGLQYNATASQSQKLPWLSQLPVLGRAFGTSATTRSRTELVIFLSAEPVG